MQPKEAKSIYKTGQIPTNRDSWGLHVAGTVVFIFEADRVPWLYVCDRAEAIIEDCGSAVILTFNGPLPTESDKSGWDQGGAVVHRGPIALANVINPQWRLCARHPEYAVCNTQATLKIP